MLLLVCLESVVRCLLSTGEPVLRSLHDMWSPPVAFLIFILNHTTIVGMCQNAKYGINNLKIACFFFR